ncbi:MAG: protein phosphatase 2C domain-containing protein [Bryobacteraceae bacterium]
MKLETAVTTNTGDRPVNQDSVACETGSGGASCWVLADGLGGHGGGERAARIAADRVLACFREAAAFDTGELKRHVQQANEAVVAAQIGARFAQMRTTIVVLVISGPHATWSHVGDSRLYRMHHGRIRQCTRDHTFLQALVDSGRMQASEVRYHEDRGRLLRSLGSPEVEADTGSCETEAGDAWLLASDGFWEPVTEREMEIEFAKAETAQSWIDGMLRRIHARPATDRDNFSAIAVFVGSAQSPR